MKRSVQLLSVVLMLVMLFCITACGKEENAQASEETHASAAELVGKWKGTEGEISTLTLGADGSYKDIAGDISIIGTYTVDSVSGTLTVNEKEYGMVFTYSYELTDDKLTLQLNGGNPRNFLRQ